MKHSALAVFSIFLNLAYASLADWKPVAPADGSFSAEMPFEPKVLDREVAGPNGPIRQVVYHGKFDGALIAIQAIATPTPGPPEARKVAADREHDGYIKAQGGKLVREGAVAVSGLPGWDFTLQGPAPDGGGGTVTSRVRLLVAEKTIYTLEVLSARDRPLPEEAGRFFDSFRLASQEAPAGPKPGETPEAILRAFLIAVILCDDAQIRALTLPAEGIELLSKGKPPAPGQALMVKVGINAQPIRALKPGDEFTLPGNRKMTVAADEIADDRAVLLPGGAPTPTRMRKVDGRWRVDARPLIAARKAVAAAKAKAEAKDNR